MRGRGWAVLALIVALGSGMTTAAAAPAGVPTLASLGLPVLTVRIADDRVDVPVTVDAGRTLVTVENGGTTARQLLLARLPDNLTGDELASPTAVGPPDWLVGFEFVGFPGVVAPGTTADAVDDLAPGQYALIDETIVARFVVTPTAVSPAPEPADVPADVTVRLYEFGFQVPESLPAGYHILQVINAGRVPHELNVSRAPAPITKDGAREIFAGDDAAATPTDGGPSMADLTEIGGLSWLAAGATAWIELDLEPGTYVLACWVFDPASGARHAMEGMVDVVTVT